MEREKRLEAIVEIAKVLSEDKDHLVYLGTQIEPWMDEADYRKGVYHEDWKKGLIKSDHVTEDGDQYSYVWRKHIFMAQKIVTAMIERGWLR